MEPVLQQRTEDELPVNHDEKVLLSLGYKQEFKREFSLWSAFCVSFAVLGLLPSFASTLFYGMGSAGTAGMIWGWIIAMVFIQCVALSLAELCSSMPTSGGLYYASAVLAPPGWGPVAAWATGWSSWIGQVTAAPSVNYAVAAMILAVLSIADPNFESKNYQLFLLATFLMIVQSCLSSMPTKWIAVFNSLGSSFNMVAVIVVIILIPTAAVTDPKFRPTHQVWSDIENGTDFPNGIAILMSFTGAMWAMSGFDAPFHLSEECAVADVASPRAIVLTSAIGGMFGWVLQVVVAYTVIDIEAVFESDLGQPWATYLLQVLPMKTGLAALALTIIAGFSMGQGCMVAASRVTYAYARDGCFPMSKYWAKVNKVTKTPVNAVWFNCLVGVLLCCLIFAGQVTVLAIFSVGAIACFVAFAIPISLRVFVVGSRFRRGPWHLGHFGKPVGVAAVGFVALMVPILCLPTNTGGSLNSSNMNWTSLVYGAPMLVALLWFAVDAHKWFKGPKVNAKHAMIGQVIKELEGQAEIY
ncbi:amino acid permease [Lindgomyces ingoldianus]|uniref:Amino acid permease n=1 Tax=Lindgomyces ingoldianus TaxID=673940 RepID=A0ACB6QB38_9PLEO|nr:amino acid permease [Lindgomyces ingoldianus]KAF2464131.1 amino acid permease [Lindgomyces ingoldianus]